jgi:hypothetical protein
MSLSEKEKLEIAGVVDLVFSKHMAEICDIIETDMKNCIVDLLLKLGPILTEQNGAFFNKLLSARRDSSCSRYETENKEELRERQRRFAETLRAK